MKNHLVVVFAPAPLSTFEFACAAEIFALHRVGLGVDWYDFGVAAIEPGTVPSTGGVPIQVEHGLELFDRADTLVFPCWRVEEAPPVPLIAAIGRAYERGARLLSICSGAFLLAEAGVLDGRRATTHWQYAEGFRRRFPRVRLEADVLYVDEGQVVTSAGSAAGIDMLLHVVRKDHGRKVCNLVARRLVVPPHREGGQAQFVERPVPVTPDCRLSRVIDWIREHAAQDHRTEDLAAMAAMSPRTFFRRFRGATGMAPYDWLIQERVAIAKDLLEEGLLSVEQVATAAGFNAAETMRHHFRRIVGRSPVEYRRMFADDPQGAERAA